MAILRPGAIRPPATGAPTTPIRPVTGPMVPAAGAIVPPRIANAGRRFNRGGMTRGNRF